MSDGPDLTAELDAAEEIATGRADTMAEVHAALAEAAAWNRIFAASRGHITTDPPAG